MRGFYSPRRAGQRWREDAPAYILDCFDTRDSGDRYTVMLVPEERRSYYETRIAYLGLDDAPFHPQGICVSGELSAYEAAGYRYRMSQRRRRVRWLDLPETVRRAVREWYEQPTGGAS